MSNPCVYDVPKDDIRMTDEDLNKFPNNLYEYLYYRLNMTNSSKCIGSRLKAIANVVLCIRNAVCDCNRYVLNQSRFCGSKEFLCQTICNEYPKKLVYFWDEGEELRDFSLGPTLWRAMFRINFAGEFSQKGGWTKLCAIATNFNNQPPKESVLRKNILPADLEGAFSSFKELRPSSTSEEAAVNEATASLKRLRIETMEEGHPKTPAKSEESDEENQPEALDDRPGTSGLGGKAAQTGGLGESSSGKSGEDVSHSLGDGKTRKRKSEVLPETDSGEESDSPRASKVMREKDKIILKRKRDSPPKSDSEKESDSTSPSAAKDRKV